MLSDTAFSVALKLREHVGADKKGIGPDTRQLVGLFDDLDPGELRVALEELNRIGFINLEIRVGTPVAGIPDEFRDVLGVTVLEAMQDYFDDQGL